MTAVYVGAFEPGSPEWYAARTDGNAGPGLGGSEIAAAAGLSPFESRFSLYHRKTGDVGPVEATPEMEWGTRLEDAIARKFLDEHPEFSDEGLRGMWRHPERPWQIANPDRLLHAARPDGDVDLTAVLETKLSLYGDGWGAAGTDEVPPHVRCQTLWYCDVFGVGTAHVAVLIGGHDYREHIVSYDVAEVELLRAIGRRFLDDVMEGVRPDIDEHTATYQTIKELHPEIDGTEVELPGAVARLFINAKTAEKEAKDAARLATSLVADEMGTAQRAVCDGRTIATRQVREGGLPFVKIARGLTGGDSADDDLVSVGGPWVDPDGGEDF